MYDIENFDDKHRRKKTFTFAARLFVMRIYRIRYYRRCLHVLLFVGSIFLLYLLLKHMLPEQYQPTLVLDDERHLFIRLFKHDDLHRQKLRPFRILSGSLHYFRVLPQAWPDRIQEMKRAGLNTIETYIPWNLHEPERGVFKFNEGLNDLSSFLKLVHQHEMFTIIRPSGKINKHEEPSK